MHSKLRVPVTAEQVRALARRRGLLAACTLPVLLVLGIGALSISSSLALVAVICGFFVYACMTIALRQRTVASEAVDFEVWLIGPRLEASGHDGRRILAAIDRADYLRLLFTDARVVGMWLDNHRDPTASLDLPASADHRAAVCEHLGALGVVVKHEGSTQRVLVLAASLVVVLLGGVLARTVLKLTTVTMLGSPWTWVLLGMLGVIAWLAYPRRT